MITIIPAKAEIRCDFPGCDKILVVPARSLYAARNLARQCGWGIVIKSESARCHAHRYAHAQHSARRNAMRDASIVMARRQGKTLKQIGEEVGITRQRVEQILAGTR